MIRIYSGWTNPGGSTVAFINLTNALNEAGYETIFYGPHNWHLGKCKSEQILGRIQLNPEDTLIAHYTDRIKFRPPIKKLILSSHEQDIFLLRNINYQIFDKIHYVSEHQRNFHNVNHPYFIIPNIANDLKPNPKPLERVAGVIGSIDRNKQVHVSINRALNDGFYKILIFGLITDQEYWYKHVAPLINNQNIIYMGYIDDKQKIYDMVTDVYQDSLLESWGYIRIECQLTNTNFHGNDTSKESKLIDKKEIVNIWIKELI